MNKIDTLQYYNNNAMEFVSGTEFADVSLLREKFLEKIPTGGMILDWGSGSGRDTAAFLAAGYQVEAVDACAELAKYASNKTGIEVRVERFDELDATNRYDGIWACASILHVERHELSHIFNLAYKALKEGGVMYTSFKYGEEDAVRRERHFSDMTEDSIKEVLVDTHFQIEEMWVTDDVREDREGDRWLNLLLRK